MAVASDAIESWLDAQGSNGSPAQRLIAGGEAVGKSQIEDGNIDSRTAARGNDLVAVLLQIAAEDLLNVFVIVHQQHAHRHHASRKPIRRHTSARVGPNRTLWSGHLSEHCTCARFGGSKVSSKLTAGGPCRSMRGDMPRSGPLPDGHSRVGATRGAGRSALRATARSAGRLATRHGSEKGGTGMYLVTGATGNVGRTLVTDLLAADETVRAFCRHPERGSFPTAVDTVVGDIADREAARAALRGVNGLFLLRMPGVETFWQEVLRSDVRSVVLLSSAAVASSVPTYMGDLHRATEDLVLAAPFSASVLRPGAFMENTLRWASLIQARGVVRAPFPDVAAAPVDARDIASAAAHLLRHPTAVRARIEPLTGPELLSVRQQVEILATVLNRPIRLEELSEEEAERQMRRYAPAEIVASLFALMRAQARELTEIHPVTRMTAAPARTFATWAEDHRHAFM